MEEYIPKSALVRELERRRDLHYKYYVKNGAGSIAECKYDEDKDILSFIDTLEVKEVDLTDAKTDWSPSKKQMESLKDMLRYNIGVFDYQKFMEVNSLYDDLTKILDYETDRQK